MFNRPPSPQITGEPPALPLFTSPTSSQLATPATRGHPKRQPVSVQKRDKKNSAANTQACLKYAWHLSLVLHLLVVPIHLHSHGTVSNQTSRLLNIAPPSLVRLKYAWHLSLVLHLQYQRPTSQLL
ncbi:hypothetical protein ACOMHN_048227 [Nucella lapillus]